MIYFLNQDGITRYNQNSYRLFEFTENHSNSTARKENYLEYFQNSLNIKENDLFD